MCFAIVENFFAILANFSCVYRKFVVILQSQILNNVNNKKFK